MLYLRLWKSQPTFKIVSRKNLMKIVITGSSGFIGSALISFLKEQGDEVIPLVRKKEEGFSYWNPDKKEIDPRIFEKVDCVINLSGENLIGRWDQKKMQRIKESRLTATEFLCETLASLSHPPKLYIGGSAVGYYGDRKEEKLTEQSAPGEGFLAQVCQKWEEIPQAFLVPKRIRVCLARFGIVLGKNGGVLEKMIPPFRLGMGGKLGDGRQIVSWISIEDLVRAIGWMIEKESLGGAINVVSPNPVTNQQMTELIGKILDKPTKLTISKMMLSLLFGSGTELFLASSNVYPQKLLESGFVFLYPELEEALKNALNM